MRGVWAPPWPFLSALPAASQRTGSGEAPREREEMDQAGTGWWGRSLQACTDPTAHPIPSGLWLPHAQPVSRWHQVPTDTAAVPGRASSGPNSDCSTGAQKAAGKGVPGGYRGAWGGKGRIHLGLTCYTQVGPCLTLPQFALLWNGRQQVTLETEGPGGGSEPSFALAGSSPAPMGSWEPQPVLRPVGMEEGLGQAGPWAPGLGGWPALPEGSSSTRSLLQRQAASASGERPCAACRQSR